MPVNSDKPHLWAADTAASVDQYNEWFLRFAPDAFRTARIQATIDVETTLQITDYLRNITPEILRRHPEVLPTLRMATYPPIAVDRLIGLAGVSTNVVRTMEKDKKIPSRMADENLVAELAKIGNIIERMADPDIFVWLQRGTPPTEAEIHRAAVIVADRLCGSVANPIIRNAQEKRQLEGIKDWLAIRGYRQLPIGNGTSFQQMEAGTFSFRLNVPATLENGTVINIPVDAVVKPLAATAESLPVFIEAKSAGDFTNVNKRRKEEAVKMSLLKSNYGDDVAFNLFLCGYFDSGYLMYEASKGIDWVWEHRIDDLAGFGI
jgi:type II restriction enzyme